MNAAPEHKRIALNLIKYDVVLALEVTRIENEEKPRKLSLRRCYFQIHGYWLFRYVFVFGAMGGSQKRDNIESTYNLYLKHFLDSSRKFYSVN